MLLIKFLSVTALLLSILIVLVLLFKPKGLILARNWNPTPPPIPQRSKKYCDCKVGICEGKESNRCAFKHATSERIKQLEFELKTSWQAGYQSGFMEGYSQPEVLINPEFEAEKKSQIIRAE